MDDRMFKQLAKRMDRTNELLEVLVAGMNLLVEGVVPDAQHEPDHKCLYFIGSNHCTFCGLERGLDQGGVPGAEVPVPELHDDSVPVG